MLVRYYNRDINNMDPFNHLKGSQYLDQKLLKALEIISE